MALQIQFDEKELDSNVQIILQASALEDAKIVQKGYQILNNSIDLFIQEYQLAFQKINTFQLGLKNLIKEWHKIKRSLVKKDEDYKQTSQYIEYLNQRSNFLKEHFTNEFKDTVLNIYFLAFKIQECLNAALGQQVITAYVFQENGEIAPQVLLSTNMQDFLKVDVSSSGNIILRYRENQENLNNHIEKLQELVRVDDKNNNNYHKLINTYNKVHTRYKNYPVKRKRGSYILWLYPNGGQKWNGVYVSSFGSVNEAYVYYLFNIDIFNPRIIQEDDMELFMNYLLINVTNESGILSGDFQNNLMEVAVKSANASTLSLKQIYNLVVKLKKQKINNFQEIMNFLKKEKDRLEKKARPINKSLKSSLQYIADEHLSTITKDFK